MKETMLAAIITGGLLIMAGAQGCRPGVLWDQSAIFPHRPERSEVSPDRRVDRLTTKDRRDLNRLLAKLDKK